MSLIRLLLPISFLLYFLWRAYRQPLFLLGIPFLQVMGNSIFFDQLKPFWIPGRLTVPGNILEWLIVVWMLSVAVVYYRQQKRLHWRDLVGPRFKLPEDGIISALALLWLFNFFTSLYDTRDFAGVFLTGIRLGGMLLGFLLVRGMVGRASSSELDSFLYAIILVNAAAAFLYILSQGFDLPLYKQVDTRQDEFLGVTFVRSFWFAPRFHFLTFAYIFSKMRWRITYWLILSLTFVSIFFTYTRTTLIILVGIILLSIILVAGKGKSLKAVRSSVIILMAGIFLYNVLFFFFPTQFLYLMGRFSSQSISTIATQGNFAVRLDFFRRAYEMLSPEHIWVGLGMATQSTNSLASNLDAWSADITWVAILYRYGLVGIVLFACLFLALMGRSLRNYFAAVNPDEEEYWLLFFLLIMATCLETFNSWTVFDSKNYTLGLWFVAFIIGAKFPANRKKQIS